MPEETPTVQPATESAGTASEEAAVDRVEAPQPNVSNEGGRVELPELGAAAQAATSAAGGPDPVSLLNDVELNVSIELGRTEMLVEDVLKLGEGSVVELDKLAGDPVDVFVNDRLVARGEVLVLNDSFCVRVSEIVAPVDGG